MYNKMGNVRNTESCLDFFFFCILDTCQMVIPCKLLWPQFFGLLLCFCAQLIVYMSALMLNLLLIRKHKFSLRRNIL
jgi:hypothetical protein